MLESAQSSVITKFSSRSVAETEPQQEPDLLGETVDAVVVSGVARAMLRKFSIARRSTKSSSSNTETKIRLATSALS
jgi:hypothetical protein